MNNTFINKPLPSPLKLIGYILSSLAIRAAIVVKFNPDTPADVNTWDLAQATFLLAFLIIMVSKVKFEDERSSEIGTVVTSYDFYLMNFFLVVLAFAHLLTYTKIPSAIIYSLALILMGIIVSLFQALSRKGLLNLMQRRMKDLRYFAVLAAIPVSSVFFGLLRLNQWIWARETLGG